MHIACTVNQHRHYLRCERCGVIDQTVAGTPVRNGPPWRPTCAQCSTKLRRMAAAMRSEMAS